MSSGGKLVCLEECRGGAIIDPRSELSILERHEYDKGLRQIFNLLTIRGDYQVIGSGAIQEIKYGSDYDLQEFVKESDYKKSTKHLLKMFQEKFRRAAADPNVFILDFKCGVDDEGKPIRWDKKSIKKGYQMVDGRKVTFQEALLMKSTIKMDITALIDGVFIEFSDNYYLTLKDFNTFTAVAKSHEDILYSLQHEAEVKYHAGDYWKAMKRIFAYMKSKGGYVPKIKQLVRYFNSTTGLLSKNRSELDIIALIITNKFRKPRLEDVVRNLQLVRQQIATIHGFKLNEVETALDKICKMPLAKMSKPLEEVIEKVKGLVNADAKRYLDKHPDITALILDTGKLKGGAKESDSESDEEKEGGSKRSGFVRRMIAEKKVKIKKVTNPSQWLLDNYKSVSEKPNIEFIIEEDEPAKKKKAKPKVELVEEVEPPKKKKAKAKVELVEEVEPPKKKKAKAKPNIEFIIEEDEPAKKKKAKAKVELVEEDAPNAIKTDTQFFGEKYNTVSKFNKIYQKVEKMAEKFAKKHVFFPDYFVRVVLTYLHQISDGQEIFALTGDEPYTVDALVSADRTDLLLQGQEEFNTADAILPFLVELKKKDIIKFELVYDPEISQLVKKYKE